MKAFSSCNDCAFSKYFTKHANCWSNDPECFKLLHFCKKKVQHIAWCNNIVASKAVLSTHLADNKVQRNIQPNWPMQPSHTESSAWAWTSLRIMISDSTMIWWSIRKSETSSEMHRRCRMTWNARRMWWQHRRSLQMRIQGFQLEWQSKKKLIENHWMFMENFTDAPISPESRCTWRSKRSGWRQQRWNRAGKVHKLTRKAFH